MPPPLKKRLKAGKRLKQQQQQHRHGLASPADLLDDLVEGEEPHFLHLGQHGSAPTTSSPDTTAFTYSRANGVLRLAPGARVAVTRRERNDQQNAHGEPCRDPCDKGMNYLPSAGCVAQHEVECEPQMVLATLDVYDVEGHCTEVASKKPDTSMSSLLSQSQQLAEKMFGLKTRYTLRQDGEGQADAVRDQDAGRDGNCVGAAAHGRPCGTGQNGEGESETSEMAAAGTGDAKGSGAIGSKIETRMRGEEAVMVGFAERL